MKIFLVSIITIVGLIIGFLVWSSTFGPKQPEANASVISRNGLHWHPQLKIFVKGEPVEIPQNIGIGAVHQPIHTHDDLPIVHLEFQGLVTEDSLRLANFFRNWGKDFNSFGSNVRMTVNGVENTEYENYVIHDSDKIELHYD